MKELFFLLLLTVNSPVSRLYPTWVRWTGLYGEEISIFLSEDSRSRSNKGGAIRKKSRRQEVEWEGKGTITRKATVQIKKKRDLKHENREEK